MTNVQPQQRFETGMVGLGVMGRNLLLNMAEHGFSAAGYDKSPSKVEALRNESAGGDICGADNINDLIDLLRPPRAAMILVPAGAPLDSAMTDLRARNLTGMARSSLVSASPAARKERAMDQASCPAVRKSSTASRHPPSGDFPNCAAGTCGPEDSQALLAKGHDRPLPTELVGLHKKKGKIS